MSDPAVIVAPHSEKAERAALMIAAAREGRAAYEAAIEAREVGLYKFSCECGRLLFLYAPPIGRARAMCKRCGTWSELTA